MPKVYTCPICKSRVHVVNMVNERWLCNRCAGKEIKKRNQEWEEVVAKIGN